MDRSSGSLLTWMLSFVALACGLGPGAADAAMPAAGLRAGGEAQPPAVSRSLTRDTTRENRLDPGGGSGLWIEEARLAPDDVTADDQFGVTVAVSGDTALVGAPGIDGGRGAVYVFTRSDGTWNEQAVLTADDGVGLDQFGFSVALEGDTALVGARWVNVDGNENQGAVYVFTRNAGTWTQQAKLTAIDGAPDDQFGNAVALAGDTALVGAYVADVDGLFNQGAAYVFTRSDGSWSEQAKLTDDDGGEIDQFGIAVALAGDTAVVGAHFADVGDNINQGAAYVFTRDGELWNPQAKLTADDGAGFDSFGAAVAAAGDTVAVGAFQADVDGAFNQGAAYVFTRTDGLWSEQAKLTADDGAASDAFGSAVAVAGETALVGADSADVNANSSQGAVYVFTRSEEVWSEQDKLTASDGTAFAGLGAVIALSGDTAVAGAPGGGFPPISGAAYAFFDFDLPPDVGVVEGTVRGLGYCGAEPAVLAGATVEIQGAESTETVETGSGGFYQAFLPESESPLTITVEVPGHLPATVEGIVFSGGDTVVQDFDLVLDAPCATVDPQELAAELPAGATETLTLSLGNGDGGGTLDWTLATAVPPSAAGRPSVLPAGEVADCDNDPGLILHDDNEVDDGYTSGNAAIEEVILVDRFTPESYPAAFRAVCVALATLGPTSLDFEIVVFDDDGGGPSGSPGTELGALPVTATDIPAWPVTEPTWTSVDISSLDIQLDSGSVYIGMRWQPVAPSEPDVVLAADEGNGSAGGGWWWNDLDGWVPMGVPGSFPEYRALFVRAVENLGGCHAPAPLPWLSPAPDSGSIAPGGGATVDVALDATGLEPGEHRASLCVTTNDPRQPLMVVPVHLTVTPPEPAPVLDVDPESLASTLEPGGTETQALTLANLGDLTLDWEIRDGEVGPAFERISAGGGHTCGVDGAGVAYCWGSNAEGQLGVGDTDDRTTPTPIDAGALDGPVAAIGTGSSHTCAVTTAGSAYCWGLNSNGQLGVDDTSPRLTPTAVAASDMGEAVEIATGWQHTCAVDADGDAFCWGSNFFGQLGNGDPPIERHVPWPVDQTELGAIAHIAAYAGSTCAVNDLDAGFCWGYNGDGNLGDGTTEQRRVPTPIVDTQLAAVDHFSLSPFHTCAVDVDGLPYCWGSNGFGQLGDGTTDNRLEPTAVVTDELTAATQIWAGEAHTCALTATGEAYCWGLNDDGQLGDGSEEERHQPTRVVDDMLGTATRIAAGGAHSCALDEIGTAWCWGLNSNGQLGDGTTGSHPLPAPVALAGTEDCTLPDWLAAAPQSGSLAAGEEQLVDVDFDAGGLEVGDYQADLCIGSNDPARPLTTVPVTLTVAEPGVPVLDLDPPALTFELAADTSETQILEVGNLGDADLEWSIGLTTYVETFDDGQNHSEWTWDQTALGGVETEGGNPDGYFRSALMAVPALFSSHSAFTGDFRQRAVGSIGGDLATVEFSAPEDKIYLALGNFNGDPGNPLDNTYATFATAIDAPVNPDYGWVSFDVPIPRDATATPEGWILSGVVPQLPPTVDWDTLITHVDVVVIAWSNPLEPTLLFDVVRGADNLRITSNPTGSGAAASALGAAGCDAQGEVPWLSVDPDAGVTPPGGDTPVDVTVDTTGLEVGTHTAQLCVASNDPEAPLTSVPVALTVVGGGEGFSPMALEVDPPGLAPKANGLFEPGESVDVAPSWRNDGSSAESLTGTTSGFTGPEGATYVIDADDTDYGVIEPDEAASCLDTGTCYRLGLDDPAMRPATHWDATFDETLDDPDGTPQTWTLHIGASFADVPSTNPFYPAIETLLHSGVTAGCTAGAEAAGVPAGRGTGLDAASDGRDGARPLQAGGAAYCPGGANSRAQMPVFVLRALEGADYTPPACVEDDPAFGDVPFDSTFCPWIEDLASRGIVSGCGNGDYCPGNPVTRAQMAIFLLKTLEGANYEPPACTERFTDVPCPSLFADWIEDLAARGITGGCTETEYCPANAVTRAQMAVFVTRTFGLTLYAP